MRRGVIILVIILFWGIGSCTKDKGPANGKSVQLNNSLDSTVSVSATVNGNNWQTDSAFGYIVKYSGNDSSRFGILITATQTGATPKSVVINLTTYTGPATYTIAPPINEVVYYVGSEQYIARSGQVVITSDTPYALIGTFNFTADSFTFSNGVFNVAMP